MKTFIKFGNPARLSEVTRTKWLREEQDRRIKSLPCTRSIRFNGRMFPNGLATSVQLGENPIRYIYFYWPAMGQWYMFQAPLDISRILTYRFSPDTEL